MCRTWEVLARNQRETNDLREQPLPMAIYVVSGDEDGERGGAPVVCIEDASKRCSEFSGGLAAWTPLLLLVPLVLGLDKVNLRCVTFSRFYGSWTMIGFSIFIYLMSQDIAEIIIRRDRCMQYCSLVFRGGYMLND